MLLREVLAAEDPFCRSSPAWDPLLTNKNKLLDSNHSCLLDNNVRIIPGVHKVNLKFPVILTLKYSVSVSGISKKTSTIVERCYILYNSLFHTPYTPQFLGKVSLSNISSVCSSS